MHSSSSAADAAPAFASILAGGKRLAPVRSFEGLRLRLAWAAIRHAALRDEHTDPDDAAIVVAWVTAWARFVNPAYVPWPGTAVDMVGAYVTATGERPSVAWVDDINTKAAVAWRALSERTAA